jgi:hypothetical protein
MSELTIHQPNEVATQREPTMLEIIREVASSPTADLSKLEKLLELQERVEARQAKTAYQQAMKAAQEEMEPVRRDGQNDSNRSRYARLETIDRAIRPIYTKHGFCLSFGSEEPRKAGAVRVTCKCLHIGGHAEPFELEADLDMTGPGGKANKTGVQGLGSSVSYLRRYLTLMIFNIQLTNEDNDGQRERGYITPGQVDQIHDICCECGMDKDPAAMSKFLGLMGVKTLSEIPAPSFRVAMNLLEGKRRQSSR